MPLPIYVDAIDREMKSPDDIGSVRVKMECINNKGDASDIVLNCDSLLNKTTIEIKRETDNIDIGMETPSSDMAAIDDGMDLLNSCDSNNDVITKNTKPTTNFLCHRCRQVFTSRGSFEMHYK